MCKKSNRDNDFKKKHITDPTITHKDTVITSADNLSYALKQNATPPKIIICTRINLTK